MGEEVAVAVDIGREMIWTAIKVAAPVLLIGFGVGLIAALLQALTSISESSLTFVPKLLGTLGAALILMPWILLVLVEYAGGIFGSMATWFP
jgi:flagellar biosynthetic protein FliQ